MLCDRCHGFPIIKKLGAKKIPEKKNHMHTHTLWYTPEKKASTVKSCKGWNLLAVFPHIYLIYLTMTLFLTEMFSVFIFWNCIQVVIAIHFECKQIDTY